MGGHEKHGSSYEEADRHRQRSRASSHHRESSSRSHRDSKETKNSHRDSTESRRSPDATSILDVNKPSDVNKTHAVLPLGSTYCPASDPQLHNEAGGSQDGGAQRKQSTEARMDELFDIMGTIVAKINHMDGKRPVEHVISDSDDAGNSDDEHQDDDRDPMDHLSTIFDSSDNNNVGEPSNDFTKALADFADCFTSKEEKGAPIHESYATILNKSLRNKPNDANIKALLQSVKIPDNVPNLTVPATNNDIMKAMPKQAKSLDYQLVRTNTLIAKAIAPLASFVADVGQKQVKPAAEYLDGINSSVRMLTAAFNFLNFSRKEIVRNYVREKGLTSLCQWDCPVGQDELFPFDVTKRCDELRKVRTLGAPNFAYRYRPQQQQQQQRKPTTNSFKWPPRSYEHHQQQRPAPYPGKGKGKAGKPFLGKRPSNDRSKKHY